MRQIGVRELKARASEVLRDVRDSHAEYVVTLRGRPVGVLLPLDEGAERLNRTDEVWDQLVGLGAQIAAGWESPLTSAELLSEMRR